ncbi:uncharacterized protein BO96DRAFT_338374 [Aspergillus niger CBS 101883]|uniref:uncharacterized protein n=1 Tax=Aspergillus lacticoffeatus (strain CBS 101883) TaxID=1450533 RepID=UPI000D7FC4EF|nr:uncharacterized protein BO96DRAFT_338374 [Aspergillus niger CBS 101883]PYH56487.1 hypothetical protein BO96DRAFT_338374 [Aspergillus niger CBS 101883]
MVKRKERQRDGLISRVDVPQQGYRQQRRFSRRVREDGDRTKARHSDSKGELRKEKRKMTPQKTQPNGRGERVREGRGDRLDPFKSSQNLHGSVEHPGGKETESERLREKRVVKVKIEKPVGGFAGFAGPQEQPAAQDFLTSRAHPRWLDVDDEPQPITPNWMEPLQPVTVAAQKNNATHPPKRGDREWKLAPVAGPEWITRTRDGSSPDESVKLVVARSCCVVCAAAAAANYSIPSRSRRCSVDFPSALACRVVLTTTMTAVVAMMIWTRSIDRSTGGPQSNIPSWIAVETASGATENMTSTMG